MGALLAFPNELCLTGVSPLEDEDPRPDDLLPDNRRPDDRLPDDRRPDDRLPDDRRPNDRLPYDPRPVRELVHASLGFPLFFFFFCDLYPGIYYRVYF